MLRDVPRRADRSVWDLCALLLDESASVSRGAQVRDLSSWRFGLGDGLIAWIHNWTYWNDLRILFIFSKYICFLYFLFDPPLPSPPAPTTTSCRDRNEKDTLSQKTQSHQRANRNGVSRMIQFFFVTVILTVVGSRVASLVVLEFCLRAVSGWVTAGPVRKPIIQWLKCMS